MNILLVHGIGHCDGPANTNYYATWRDDITRGLQDAGMADPPAFIEFHYDDIFEAHYAGPGTYAASIVELAGTAAVHAIYDPLADFVDGLFHPAAREFEYGGDTVRWYVGMVAQFAVEGALRKDLRDSLYKTLIAQPPDLIVAHSLGSLLTFDFLRNDPRAAVLKAATYLTLGSQINNAFVRSRLWPGRLRMPKVAAWYHLFNPQDKVFTGPINIPGSESFHQVQTDSAAGHAATATAAGPGYLDNPNTVDLVWKPLAQTPLSHEVVRNLSAVQSALAKPVRRALLIGLNEYPDPANRLNGCINDTFLISAVLQERGFDAADIRVLHDDRATAGAIRDRLQWLLEGAEDGMERILFYSGHGAQLPAYNAAEVVDHVDECLVPYDFNWTKERAITDDDFYNLYSDLPFSAHFFAVFDCCHSGGLNRDGGAKVRGIVPPDDIRHRLLRWNAAEQMWEQKDLPSINPQYGGTIQDRSHMMGADESTYRLGRGMRLRRHISKAEGKKLVKAKSGLYLPVILEACGEEELSYEYRAGSTSYGAFTYSFVKNLRQAPGATFQQVMDTTTKTLATLGYQQTPQLTGPSRVITASIPGAPAMPAAKTAKAVKAAKPRKAAKAAKARRGK